MVTFGSRYLRGREAGVETTIELGEYTCGGEKASVQDVVQIGIGRAVRRRFCRIPCLDRAWIIRRIDHRLEIRGQVVARHCYTERQIEFRIRWHIAYPLRVPLKQRLSAR